MLLAASTQRTIGFVILAIVFVGGLVYLFFNIRAAKGEVGSEIDLPPIAATMSTTKTLKANGWISPWAPT